MENQIFLLSLNRAGENYGASLFCPPWIDERTPTTEFPARKEALVYLMADKEQIAEVRTKYSFRADRLACYDELDL